MRSSHKRRRKVDLIVPAKFNAFTEEFRVPKILEREPCCLYSKTNTQISIALHKTFSTIMSILKSRESLNMTFFVKNLSGKVSVCFVVSIGTKEKSTF